MGNSAEFLIPNLFFLQVASSQDPPFLSPSLKPGCSSSLSSSCGFCSPFLSHSHYSFSKTRVSPGPPAQ